MRRLTVLAAVVVALVVLAQPSATAHATYGHDYGQSYHGGNVHCVRYGETLYSIAWRYGTSAHAIAAANGIYNPNYIRAGHCLRIPSGKGHVAYPPVSKAPHYAPVKKAPHYGHGFDHGYGYGKMQGGRYCVRYGDTLSKIAWRYGTSAYAIAHANGIYNPNHIRAGQCLTIPGYRY